MSFAKSFSRSWLSSRVPLLCSSNRRNNRASSSPASAGRHSSWASRQRPFTSHRSNALSLTGDTDSMRAMEDDALECFIASDASALVEHTKKVVVLEDDDVLHLSHGAFGIYSASDGQRGDKFLTDGVSLACRQLSTLDMEVASIMKGGYEHFMAKEIHAQPDSILQTMRGGSLSFLMVPVAWTLTFELLSNHMTVLRGHSVDQPRNLAKSVTVTEH